MHLHEFNYASSIFDAYEIIYIIDLKAINPTAKTVSLGIKKLWGRRRKKKREGGGSVPFREESKK